MIVLPILQLDSIKILNRTRNVDTLLQWPDTVMVLNYHGVGYESMGTEKAFYLNQNYPNPVYDQTTISVFIPEKDKTYLMISDLLGRQVISESKVLEAGKHFFRFSPGNGDVFFLTIMWRGINQSIKILNAMNESDQQPELN